jgi:hypothetical protein
LYFACGLIKDIGGGGYPMMHHGACMVKLTRLPPSKHVLTLSTPLISKKIKIRAINEFKYKFRGVFKALKTRCKSKIFSDYIYIGLTGIVCFN